MTMEFSHILGSTKSKRTPKYSTIFNNADNIERYLEKDGHRTWGFVIYRCIYRSDDEWNRFITLARDSTHHVIEIQNGADMMESFTLTVFEDKSSFNGATTSVVREHFKRWSETAPQIEQGTGPGMAQRYRYCIHVDTTVLESIIKTKSDNQDHPDPYHTYGGVVNLVSGDWEPDKPNPELDVKEPLEGCTQESVGWMRVALIDVMVGGYHYLRDSYSWDPEYRRPPEVARL